VIGFDDDLAHRIEAGADLFLMPSRYEPCGLNQMMSLRYGTVPVVRAIGGLADTVHDFDPASREGTGFVFQAYDAAEMTAAVKRALALYRQPRVWQRIVENGMKQDFSWDVSAGRYEEAYREARSRVEARRFRDWAQGMARA
jgi:starch synthase